MRPNIIPNLEFWSNIFPTQRLCIGFAVVLLITLSVGTGQVLCRLLSHSVLIGFETKRTEMYILTCSWTYNSFALQNSLAMDPLKLMQSKLEFYNTSSRIVKWMMLHYLKMHKSCLILKMYISVANLPSHSLLSTLWFQIANALSELMELYLSWGSEFQITVHLLRHQKLL